MAVRVGRPQLPPALTLNPARVERGKAGSAGSSQAPEPQKARRKEGRREGGPERISSVRGSRLATIFENRGKQELSSSGRGTTAAED